MTVDEQRGLVYMPLGGPSANYYGGDRKGANLFGNSIVAVEADTGKMKWYFQAIHHDIWDYDLPPAPGLIDIVQNGKKDSGAGASRQAGLHVHSRSRHRQAVFGVEERPVPKSDVPGEWYFAHPADSAEASRAVAATVSAWTMWSRPKTPRPSMPRRARN